MGVRHASFLFMKSYNALAYFVNGLIIKHRNYLRPSGQPALTTRRATLFVRALIAFEIVIMFIP